MCMAGALPPLENVPFNMRVTDLKRRIHEVRADLPAHTQRLVVMTQSVDGESSSHVVLGDNETLDSFACVTDGCTIQVVMAQGRVTFEAAAYVAAVLEYLSAEILELSGNAAHDHGKTNIGVFDIRMVLCCDEELNPMMGCLAMYRKRALPFMFPEFDAEYARSLVENAEGLDHYKYANWGVDEEERGNSSDDDVKVDRETANDELARVEETEDDDSSSRWTDDAAAAFLSTHVKQLLLRRGVMTHLELDYHDGIFKVLKQVHPLMGITKRGMETVNLFVNLTLNAILSFAFYRVAEGFERTVTQIAIQDAVQVVLSGELAIHATSEGTRATTRLSSAMRGDPLKPRPNQTFSECAGLQFPLYHQYLNAAFATGFSPGPVAQPSPSGSSFHIVIQPGVLPEFTNSLEGHAFCLEVTGDDCVSDVMSRARSVFHLSTSQEYAFLLVTKYDKDLDNTSEVLLDAGRTLSSYGIDSRCWDAFTIASQSDDGKPRPSLLLFKINDLFLQNDIVVLNAALKSNSQSTLDEMLSQGSRCLRASRIMDGINDKDDIILQALLQNNWSGIYLGYMSAGDNKTFSVETGPKAESPAPAIAPITQLASVLRTNASITELRLHGSDLSPAEVENLVAALKCNAFIKSLRLIKFDFSGRAGKALVDLLRQLDADSGSRRHASAIETLVIRHSKVKKFPFKALCAALKCNATLTSIDLGTFFDSGASANLMDALEHNPRIISVWIDAKVFQDSKETAVSIDRILRARFLASCDSVDDSSSI